MEIVGRGINGEKDFGLDSKIVERIANEIAVVYSLGVQVCLVIGAGNIFRGVAGPAALKEPALIIWACLQQL